MDVTTCLQRGHAYLTLYFATFPHTSVLMFGPGALSGRICVDGEITENPSLSPSNHPNRPKNHGDIHVR